MDRMRYWFDVKASREPKAERYEGHFEDFISKLKPNGKPLCFDIDGNEPYKLEPFFDFQDGEFVCFPLFAKQ